MTLEEQARIQKLGEIRRHHSDKSPVGEFCECCFVLSELDAALVARRRITVSELETAAKAMHEASAARFGWRRGDWDNVDDEVKKHRLFEAKAAPSNARYRGGR